jgi:aminocarboxymuconate-semialdehyde decarboxylase
MEKKTRREFLKTTAMAAAMVSASAGLITKGQAQTKKAFMIVDMHSHMEIPEAVALLPEKPKPLSSPVSAATAAYQEKLVAALRQQLQDPEKRIEDMDKAGIDQCILSIAPAQFFYNLEGQLAIDVSRKQNDQFAERVQKYPKRFTAIATVPLQNPEAAAKELERAVRELKLKGVQIGSNVRRTYLGDKKFLPFFDKAAELDVPTFIHPIDTAGAERLKEYYLPNVIGNPLDTTITAATLVFSGIFDRLPNLKIVLAHAGGLVPYNIDRWDHGFKVRPECKVSIQRPPSMYLRNFYYDTIAHGTESLRFLISRVGVDRVVVGTDYPYDMGDLDPLKTLKAANLSAEEWDKIVWRNTAALFKLV